MSMGAAQFRRHNQKGLTLIELLIGALLAAIVGAATLEFYKAQHQLYLAETDISERQGNLRFAIDELGRQIRQAGYLVTGNKRMRTSALFDTLEVYVGRPASTVVDTLRYYVNRFDTPPSLVKQLNKTTPAVFAQGIDTARFVPSGGPPVQQVAVVLVSVEQKQYSNSALKTRRRLGETVNLRN
jgi:type II secretory pathway pseudopilin PulG